MNKIQRAIKYFAVPYVIFVIVLLTMVIIYRKGELHLLLNSYRTSFLNEFFKYYTETGGVVPFIIGALFAFFHRLKASFYIFVTLILNALITSGLKLWFRIPRPKTFFSEHLPDTMLQYVEGVKVHAFNGFPSGHTSAAFAFMMCVALICRNRTVSVICCLLAILVGYSRIYLSQHFAEDVLLGSVVGVTVALALYPVYEKLGTKYTWTERSLLRISRKSTIPD